MSINSKGAGIHCDEKCRWTVNRPSVLVAILLKDWGGRWSPQNGAARDMKETENASRNGEGEGG